MYKVTIRFEDGRELPTGDDFDDLGEACRFTLDLADRSGRSKGDGHGPAKWVRIYLGEELQIAISVVPGGLL